MDNHPVEIAFHPSDGLDGRKAALQKLILALDCMGH
jgi:hypothetical protein